jgi:hypothetical protein
MLPHQRWTRFAGAIYGLSPGSTWNAEHQASLCDSLFRCNEIFLDTIAASFVCCLRVSALGALQIRLVNPEQLPGRILAPTELVLGGDAALHRGWLGGRGFVLWSTSNSAAERLPGASRPFRAARSAARDLPRCMNPDCRQMTTAVVTG